MNETYANVKFCVNLRNTPEDIQNNRATIFLQKQQHDKIVSLKKPIPKEFITEYISNEDYSIDEFNPTFIHFNNAYHDSK